MKIVYTILLSLLFLPFQSCQKEDVNRLSVSQSKFEIPAEGGATSFVIQTDAESWTISHSGEDWVKLSISSGTQKEAIVSASISSKSLSNRADTLIIQAGSAKPVYVIIAQASSEYIYELSTNITTASFSVAAATTTITVTGDVPAWQLSTDADWIQLSHTEGTTGAKEVELAVTANSSTSKRTANVTLSGTGAPTTVIAVSQKASYPNYNTSPIAPDATGMSSTAAELAAKIKVGWNIGNTLEASGGETAWGNPKVTNELIQLVKQNGFNAIRIPCAWNQYLANSTTAEIKSTWLNRVKQVVQYCVDNDMYVILNIHWDGGWLENNITPEKQADVNDKQRAFWQQIATHFRDFDEHLIFASANEPNVDNATQMAVLKIYHQTFIDAVRSTGGHNSYRVLVVQGPATDIEKTNNLMNSLPTDEIANKMMVEIHYYTPYQFCLMSEDASWGKMFYYWGKDYHSTTDPDRNATWGEEAQLDELMASMKNKFVDKGIPVILGEFAVIKRTNLAGDALTLHLASRAYFLKYMTQKAKANGLLPFYWDAGNMEENASALFNRENNTVFDQQALDAIMEGADN